MNRIMQLGLVLSAAVLFRVSAAMSGEKAPPQPADANAPQPAAQAPKPSDGCTYKGKPRNEMWFEAMYARFSNKIACVDGKYVDVGLARLHGLQVQGKEPPTPGTELRTAPAHSEVFQVLGKEEALVRRAASQGRIIGGGSGPASAWGSIAAAGLSVPEVLFHVKGLDTARLVDGADFPDKIDLLYVGTYTYDTPIGATNTLQSFRVYKPLTREQFAKALGSSFALVDYRLVPVPKPDEVSERQNPRWAKGLICKMEAGGIEYYRVVPQPVL
ncbi:MAG: hypothetical protein NTU94_13790 [Planctomycetota bacterium]|nr:hypothetical protein [Planctomycetota bacterium]